MPFPRRTGTGHTRPSSASLTLPRLPSPVPNLKGNRKVTQTAREHPHRTHTHVHPKHQWNQLPTDQPRAPIPPPPAPTRLWPQDHAGEADREDRKRTTGDRGVASIPPARKKLHKSPPRLRLDSRHAGALPFASLTNLSPKAAAGTRTAPHLGAAMLEETALHFPQVCGATRRRSHNPLRRPEALVFLRGLEASGSEPLCITVKTWLPHLRE